MSVAPHLGENGWITAVERCVESLARNWLLLLNLGVGLYALLPWLSPLARAWGWEPLGLAILRTYRFFCHQQPALSYHLFGYPVAYCQRDTAIYTTIWLSGLAFAASGRRWRPLPWGVFLGATALLALDGISLTLDRLLAGGSLRGDNDWAVWLTRGWLPAWFYAGDQVGHLNWWLRTSTGVLFGLTLTWALYPRVEGQRPNRFGQP